MKFSIKTLGPGFIFAGAAIGVSHLVQSTRAGADFGLGLLWALLLINLVKYPFFAFGPRYAAATGESLLDGYKRMGDWVLGVYFLLTFATMFTIQTAVTIVTAGIASSLFGVGSPIFWTFLISICCFAILLLGRYKVLDRLMRIIVIGLTLSTITAVVLALPQSHLTSWHQEFPTETASVAFLIAFMGWMPAPLDIAVWNSMWTIEKKKLQPSIDRRGSSLDFNTGYITTTLLAIGFLLLGALVMHPSGQSFSGQGGVFANQLIDLYASTLGEWTRSLIGVAALTTMLSTTLTTLDGSPRVMHRTSELLSRRTFDKGYSFWLIVLSTGTLLIFTLLLSEMRLLVDIATILSFLTEPFYATLNLLLITGKHTPIEDRPGKMMRIYSVLSIGVLLLFSGWYLSTIL